MRICCTAPTDTRNDARVTHERCVIKDDPRCSPRPTDSSALKRIQSAIWEADGYAPGNI